MVASRPTGTMVPMPRPIAWLLRALAYLALAQAVSATIAWAVSELHCSGSLAVRRCDDAGSQALSDYAYLSMIVGAFTVIPAVLAIAGLVLVVRDVSRWRRARAGEQPR